MPDFYTVVTDTGLQALGLATTQGQSFSLTHAVVGDGNGVAVVPNKGMATLVNEVWRGNVAGIKVDPEDPNTLIFEFAIPADTGGFTIREVGLLDESGKLFCIGNFPDTEKPVAADGSVRDLVVRLPLHFENADVVNLVINAAIVLATKQDITDHNEDPEAHRFATKEQTGFARFATDGEHIAHSRDKIAASPWGVWKLLESVMSNACASTSTITIATSNAVSQVFNRIEAHKAANDPHGVVDKVKALLSSSITNASSTTFATSLAVKTVNDRLNTHKGEVDPHGAVDKAKSLLSDSITSTSTTSFASPKAVKTVNDNLNAHKNATDPHNAQGRVNSKMTWHLGVSDPHGVVAKVKALLSSSVTSTSTTTFATPKAVKTVRDLIVGHTGDAEAHSAGIHGGIELFDGAVNAEGRPIDAKTGQPDLRYGACDGRTYAAPDGRQVTTPDMRDRFPVGAGGKYSVGSKGGADLVTTTKSQTAAHKHGIWLSKQNGASSDNDGSPLTNHDYRTYHKDTEPTSDWVSGAGVGNPLGDTGGSGAHENRPPYCGLFFIKRL